MLRILLIQPTRYDPEIVSNLAQSFCTFDRYCIISQSNPQDGMRYDEGVSCMVSYSPVYPFLGYWFAVSIVILRVLFCSVSAFLCVVLIYSLIHSFLCIGVGHVGAQRTAVSFNYLTQFWFLFTCLVGLQKF